MPLNTPYYVLKVSQSPECYANAHSKRINDFPEENDEELVVPRKLKNQSQDDGWRHEIDRDHDVESVFWILLYWAMAAQPAGGRPRGYIHAPSWTGLLGDFKTRGRLVVGLRSGDPPDNLTHSVYKPLWPLVSNLAAIHCVAVPVTAHISSRDERVTQRLKRLTTIEKNAPDMNHTAVLVAITESHICLASSIDNVRGFESPELEPLSAHWQCLCKSLQ